MGNGWAHYGMNGYGPDGSWFGLWGLGHGLFSILFVVLAIVLVWTLVRHLREPARQESQFRRTEAIDILAARFARGEISADEYFERKSILQSGDGSA